MRDARASIGRIPAMLLLLTTLLGGAGTATAQEAGTLVGRVTDQDARPLVGVEVRLGGTSLVAVTDRTGT